MKFKKFWLIPLLLFLAMGIAGCNKQKKAAPVLTKTQVINKAKKSFKSGQVIQSIRLASDTSTQIVAANTIFGGDNGTVYHITNQTTSKGKTQSSEEWINMNNVFIAGKGTWYKANLSTLSGHTYADLASAIMANQVLTNPSKALVKAYKMTRKGTTYTLNAKVTDQATMKNAAEPIATTTGITAQQKKLFEQIAKVGKYQNMTVKLVIKDKKLYAANIFVNAKVGNQKVVFGQSYGNFGTHDFLKVPTNALNAKPLPTQKTKTVKRTKVIKKTVKK